MEQMTDFQTFIRVNKLKQKQVAEYLGTSSQYINQVAKGKCALSSDKLEMLAQSGWDVSMLTFPPYIKVPAATMSPIGDEWVEADFSQEPRMTMQKREDGTVVIYHTPEQRSRATAYARQLQRKGVGVILDPSAPAGVTGTLPKAQPSATPTEAMRDGVNVITDASVLDMSAIPAAIVEEVKEEVREEVIAEVQKAEAVPIIPSEVAKRENLDIGEWLNENESELEHFIPSQMTADVDGVERVRKTSMFPTLAPQDWVFIKLVDKSLMLDGETYYFKLRKLPTMIRMVKFEGEGKLRLIAQNPKFGDIITSEDDIINVATIEGMFRKNIANQYDEIETLRRKKDAQTDELIKCNGDLIKQNGDALKIVDRLVSVIEKKQ